MRPRVFTAEDQLILEIPGTKIAARFNEAAGIHRGRPIVAEDQLTEAQTASMRPRVFTAEDHREPAGPGGERCRFNEAAGIHRGRRRGLRVQSSRGRLLQ